MFALEEVMGDLNAPVLGLSRACFGYFVGRSEGCCWAMSRSSKYRSHSLQSAWEFGIYAVLGVAGGFLSRSLYANAPDHAAMVFESARPKLGGGTQ